MQALSNKRKVSKKSTSDNPNQLSLDFKQHESEIELHQPKQRIKLDPSIMTHSKRSMITLSV